MAAEQMKKFAEINRASQQNAVEFNDFTRSLANWCENIDATDKMLSEQNLASNQPNQYNISQPVRSKIKENKTVINQPEKPQKKSINVNDPQIPRTTSKPKAEVSKTTPTSTSSVSKSKIKKSAAPRSAQQWDKFDLDAALQSSEDEPELTEMTGKNDRLKLDSATKMKQDGNNFIQKGKLKPAIECYTAGITLLSGVVNKTDDFNSLMSAFYGNRGLAYYKNGQLVLAESDYSNALAIDPTYIKVIKRRAQTRIDLNKIASAKQDLNRCLKLDPKDKQAKEMLENMGERGHMIPKTTPEQKIAKKSSQKFGEVEKPKQTDVTNYPMEKILIKNLDPAVEKPIEIVVDSKPRTEEKITPKPANKSQNQAPAESQPPAKTQETLTEKISQNYTKHQKKGKPIDYEQQKLDRQFKELDDVAQQLEQARLDLQKQHAEINKMETQQQTVQQQLTQEVTKQIDSTAKKGEKAVGYLETVQKEAQNSVSETSSSKTEKLPPVATSCETFFENLEKISAENSKISWILLVVLGEFLQNFP